MEPLDALKALSQALAESQARMTAHGEPFHGFGDNLQALSGALQELQTELTPEPEPKPEAVSPQEAPPPSTPGYHECGGLADLPEMQARLQQITWPPDIRTPAAVIAAALQLADVSGQDLVYDLGCGDARVLIAAARQRQARGVGIEMDPTLVAEARAAVAQAGLEQRIQIHQGDVRAAHFRDASVVYLFLGKKFNLQLRRALRLHLRPGARIVSHGFDMGDWKPAQTVVVIDDHGHKHRLLLWRIEAAADEPPQKFDEWEDWDDMLCSPRE